MDYNNIHEKPDDHILVENGDIFDGTREQFRDSFFDNAYDNQITEWCVKNDWVLTINNNPIRY